jgi:hypothetical protein
VPPPAVEGLENRVREPERQLVVETTVSDLIFRLREASDRMVPFSEAQRVLKEAASAIERLDGAARDHAAEAGRLAAELALLRPDARRS